MGTTTSKNTGCLMSLTANIVISMSVAMSPTKTILLQSNCSGNETDIP
jgi:hypothetical protein